MKTAFALFCVCTFGAAFLPGCGETEPAPRTYDFTEVDSAVADFLEAYGAYGVSGLTLAVVQRDDGKIYEKGYGDFDPDRVSLIRSTGKVLSAGVILTLVDDGLLDLDRPVAEYLDWGDQHASVTTRQLLSMMSGIPEGELCNTDPTTTLQVCARSIFEDESQSMLPGKAFNYSADAWQLAGAVAEVVSGRSWAQLVDEKLLKPCGLQNTGYRIFDPSMGYPEDLDGGPASIPPSDNANIGGGAYTSVADYSEVLMMHLRQGRCMEERVLSEAMVQAMQEALVPEGVVLPPWRPEASNYGMGWWWFEEDPPMFVDSGSSGARSVLNPEEGWGAILIIEFNTIVGAIMYEDVVPHIRAAVLAAN